MTRTIYYEDIRSNGSTKMLTTRRRRVRTTESHRICQAAVEAFRSGDADALAKALGLALWQFPTIVPLDQPKISPEWSAGRSWWLQGQALHRALIEASGCGFGEGAPKRASELTPPWEA